MNYSDPRAKRRIVLWKLCCAGNPADLYSFP